MKNILRPEIELKLKKLELFLLEVELWPIELELELLELLELLLCLAVATVYCIVLELQELGLKLQGLRRFCY